MCKVETDPTRPARSCLPTSPAFRENRLLRPPPPPPPTKQSLEKLVLYGTDEQDDGVVGGVEATLASQPLRKQACKSSLGYPGKNQIEHDILGYIGTRAPQE